VFSGLENSHLHRKDNHMKDAPRKLRVVVTVEELDSPSSGDASATQELPTESRKQLARYVIDLFRWLLSWLP
jgi:hypothetical protein